MELTLPPLSALRLRLGSAAARLSGRGTRYSGRFERWADARAASRGWAEPHILEKVGAAAAKVQRGEAACERDSVSFGSVEYSFPVLATLLRALLENAGRLCVLDFGGSLGSSYYPCRGFMPSACEIRWQIVEQPHFVARGRQMETRELKFFASISEVSRPDVVLVSSVLQYLEDPYATLRELAAAGSRYLVIDRTPLSAKPEDRLTVQHVPAQIYAASYPCWILSRDRVVGNLASGWQVLSEFPSLDGWGVAGFDCFRHGGMLLRRKS